MISPGSTQSQPATSPPAGAFETESIAVNCLRFLHHFRLRLPAPHRSNSPRRIMRRLYLATFCLALAVCSTAVARPQSTSSPLPPKEAERVIARRATQVILALKSRNAGKLSEFVHPKKGLRFSPYHCVYLDKPRDRVLTSRQVKTLMTDKKRYLWGEEDASGDPIRLTFAAYRRKYVYDHDYLKAKQITYNAEFLSSGNLVNNIRATYPAAIIVEYHFPGFDEKYGGMDWNSIWLVFEKQGREWYLVGIAHGEWTI
jgi:hypothetical protein